MKQIAHLRFTAGELPWKPAPTRIQAQEAGAALIWERLEKAGWSVVALSVHANEYMSEGEIWDVVLRGDGDAMAFSDLRNYLFPMPKG